MTVRPKKPTYASFTPRGSRYRLASQLGRDFTSPEHLRHSGVKPTARLHWLEDGGSRISATLEVMNEDLGPPLRLLDLALTLNAIHEAKQAVMARLDELEKKLARVPGGSNSGAKKRAATRSRT